MGSRAAASCGPRPPHRRSRPHGPRPSCCRPPSGAARRTPSRSRSKWPAGGLQIRRLPTASAALRLQLPRTATSPSPITCARRWPPRRRWSRPRVSQLGAQRRSRLLDHRRRLHAALHRAVGRRPFLRRGTARSADAGGCSAHENVLLVAYDIEARGPLGRRWRAAGIFCRRRWSSRRNAVRKLLAGVRLAAGRRVTARTQRRSRCRTPRWWRAMPRRLPALYGGARARRRRTTCSRLATPTLGLRHAHRVF